uniref:Uncharacterized protein n=1 Tax=uncultured Flavobacteriia bacterium TaxID=212695 RepID=H6RGM9_9BACT|nr:hypothetical protein VIS_S3CNB120010 [uncultured Flavobacteriia bacterium]
MPFNQLCFSIYYMLDKVFAFLLWKQFYYDICDSA